MMSNTTITSISPSKELCAVTSIEKAHYLIQIYDLNQTTIGSLKFTLLDRTAAAATTSDDQNQNEQRWVRMEFTNDSNYLIVLVVDTSFKKNSSMIYIWDIRRSVLAYKYNPTINEENDEGGRNILDMTVSSIDGNKFYLLSTTTTNNNNKKCLLYEYHITSKDGIKLVKKIKTGTKVHSTTDKEEEPHLARSSSSSNNSRCLHVFSIITGDVKSQKEDVAAISIPSNSNNNNNNTDQEEQQQVIRFINLNDGTRLSKLSLQESSILQGISQPSNLYMAMVRDGSSSSTIDIYYNPVVVNEHSSHTTSTEPVASIQISPALLLLSSFSNTDDIIENVELLEEENINNENDNENDHERIIKVLVTLQNNGGFMIYKVTIPSIEEDDNAAAAAAVALSSEESPSSKKKKSSKKHKKNKKRKHDDHDATTTTTSTTTSKGIVQLIANSTSTTTNDDDNNNNNNDDIESFHYQILRCMFLSLNNMERICIVAQNLSTDEIVIRTVKYTSTTTINNDDTSTNSTATTTTAVNNIVLCDLFLNEFKKNNYTATTTTTKVLQKRKGMDGTTTTTSTNTVLLGPGDDSTTHGSNLNISDMSETIGTIKSSSKTEDNGTTTIATKKKRTKKDDKEFWNIDNKSKEEEEGSSTVIQLSETTIAERMEALTSTTVDIDDDDDDDDAIFSDDDNKDKNNKEVKEKTSITNNINNTKNETSLNVLLKQSLMGNDEIQLEHVLTCHDVKIIQRTLKDLDSDVDLIVSLLLKLCHRISIKPSRAIPLATIWIRLLLEIHYDTLLIASTTQDEEQSLNLGHVLGPILGLLKERTDNYPMLLKLDGRLTMLRRGNK